MKEALNATIAYLDAAYRMISRSIVESRNEASGYSLEQQQKLMQFRTEIVNLRNDFRKLTDAGKTVVIRRQVWAQGTVMQLDDEVAKVLLADGSEITVPVNELHTATHEQTNYASPPNDNMC